MGSRGRAMVAGQAVGVGRLMHRAQFGVLLVAVGDRGTVAAGTGGGVAVAGDVCFTLLPGLGLLPLRWDEL